MFVASYSTKKYFYYLVYITFLQSRHTILLVVIIPKSTHWAPHRIHWFVPLPIAFLFMLSNLSTNRLQTSLKLYSNSMKKYSPGILDTFNFKNPSTARNITWKTKRIPLHRYLLVLLFKVNQIRMKSANNRLIYQPARMY